MSVCVSNRVVCSGCESRVLIDVHDLCTYQSSARNLFKRVHNEIHNIQETILLSQTMYRVIVNGS